MEHRQHLNLKMDRSDQSRNILSLPFDSLTVRSGILKGSLFRAFFCFVSEFVRNMMTKWWIQIIALGYQFTLHRLLVCRLKWGWSSDGHRYPRVGVTYAPFINFCASKNFDLAKEPLRFFESRVYLTGAPAAELPRHLSNINVKFNS